MRQNGGGAYDAGHQRQGCVLRAGARPGGLQGGHRQQLLACSRDPTRPPPISLVLLCRLLFVFSSSFVVEQKEYPPGLPCLVVDGRPRCSTRTRLICSWSRSSVRLEHMPQTQAHTRASLSSHVNLSSSLV